MAIKKYIGPNRLSEIFSYIKAELDKKVTAVSGKGLSSNDYTTTEKNKLAGISSGAEVNVQADWDEDKTSSDAYILHKPTSMPASDVPSWAKQPNKPSYSFSEITSKPTTIAGYGITDAKIANGVITLGSNTITPLTQHQSVTDNNPTLSWGTKSKVATIGSTAINVTMPSNPNTDTKVTSVGNHYSPAEDSTAQLDADASSSTAATWNSTSLVTGVTVKRDAKGHVTGLAVDSIKMPANPNTNTTYTFADGTNGFTVTPSGGTAQTVKVTPSITNNVTGSGTSGYLAKFNGGNTITSGPQLGSSTTTYLRNDGSWATPPDNNTTYTIATGDGNGQIKVTPSSGSAYNVSVKGLGSSAYTTEDSISPYEANLRWGGKNFTGSYGPIDAALMDELGANRFQFIKASAITVEYSRDGGSTWTDYGATDAQKQQIFAQGGSLAIGKNDSSNKATANGGKYKLRITIDTGAANVYSVLNKFVIYCSTNGSAGCYCQIQIALQSTPTTFIDHTSNISIGGWSGYNVINTGAFVTYGNSPASQYGRVRFIFGDGTGGNTNYNGLNIFQIKAFGGVGWSTPSTMAKSRHLYSYDENQNATFPADLYMSAGTIITPRNDSKGIRPNANNWGEVGDASYYFYKCYCTNYYGTTSYVTNWSRNNNIGSPSTSSAASGTGLVNFYNTCAAGGTQTKTTLSVDTSVNSNITVYLPKASGNLALAATTLAGYGITDAKIANGTITLGSNTITPLTSITSSQVTTALGYTPYNSSNPNGYITSSGSCASATSATKVTQTGLTTYDYQTKYEVLLSGTADNTTRDDGVNKTAKLTATQTGALYANECYAWGVHAGGDNTNHRGAVYFYKDTNASVYSYVKMQPVCSDATNKEILVPDENGTLATREWYRNTGVSKLGTSGTMTTAFCSVYGGARHIFIKNTTTTAISQSYGNWYYISLSIPIPSSLKFDYTKGYVVSVNVVSGSGLHTASVYGLSNTAVNIFLSSAKTESSKTYIISIHLICLNSTTDF